MSKNITPATIAGNLGWTRDSNPELCSHSAVFYLYPQNAFVWEFKLGPSFLSTRWDSNSQIKELQSFLLAIWVHVHYWVNPGLEPYTPQSQCGILPVKLDSPFYQLICGKGGSRTHTSHKLLTVFKTAATACWLALPFLIIFLLSGGQGARTLTTVSRGLL